MELFTCLLKTWGSQHTASGSELATDGMGWISSILLCSLRNSTGCGSAVQYIETPIGSRPEHKLFPHTQTAQAYANLPNKAEAQTTIISNKNPPLNYLIDVYVNNFIGPVIPTTCTQLDHVTHSIMCWVHYVFLPHKVDTEDPLAFKNLIKGDGTWDKIKELLGFVFNGTDKTMWLLEGKRDALILFIKIWLWSTQKNAWFGIPFKEFCSSLYKIRHSFTLIPAGHGLMSPFYWVLSKAHKTAFLWCNKMLYTALQDCHHFLQE